MATKFFFSILDINWIYLHQKRYVQIIPQNYIDLHIFRNLSFLMLKFQIFNCHYENSEINFIFWRLPGEKKASYTLSNYMIGIEFIFKKTVILTMVIFTEHFVVDKKELLKSSIFFLIPSFMNQIIVLMVIFKIKYSKL